MWLTLDQTEDISQPKYTCLIPLTDVTTSKSANYRDAIITQVLAVQRQQSCQVTSVSSVLSTV